MSLSDLYVRDGDLYLVNPILGDTPSARAKTIARFLGCRVEELPEDDLPTSGYILYTPIGSERPIIPQGHNVRQLKSRFQVWEKEIFELYFERRSDVQRKS